MGESEQPAGRTEPADLGETAPCPPPPTPASEPSPVSLQPTLSADGERRSPDPTPLSRGESVGRYVIVDRLGAGGMGVVYRAFDPDLDRAVALKLVSVSRFGDGEDRQRLLREAQAMARLSHPNVIPVFDVGVDGDAIFVAMELVGGGTMTAWLAAEDRPWRIVLDRFLDAGRGLAAAHRAELIHRDFKPDNVMIDDDDRVRVLDFGLARTTASASGDEVETTEALRAISGSNLSGGASLDASMTADGTVMGTPAYMSPEQHLGARVDAASDQFSFCVALWEALYGRRPFEGETLGAIALHVTQGKIVDPPAGNDVPGWVRDVLVRGMANDPARRFGSMEALLAALATDPRARRRKLALGLGAGAAMLAAGSALGMGVQRGAAGAEPCQGAAGAIAPTWNDARRDALSEAFLATGLSYAPAVWDNAAARVDGYVAAWTDGHTAACRATRVDGAQSEARLDQRMLCLERRRVALDRLLRALADPDDGAVQRTIDAVRGLPAIEACASPEAGASPASLPDDPDTRAAIAAAQSTLDDASAQLSLGHYVHARGLIAPVIATAGITDYDPLTVRVRWLLADVESNAGTPEAAREAWLSAYYAAVAADDPAAQARLASELAHAVGYRAADAAGGQMWLSLGRALLRRPGVPPDIAAELDSAEAATAVAAGDYPAALAAHERALAYWRAHEPDSPGQARVLDDIGAVEALLGHAETAIDRHRDAIAIRQRVYGDDHPIVAYSQRELGMALSKAGRNDEAMAPIRAALAIHRQARGESNTNVAVCLDDLGRLERARGNLDEALRLHQQALPIWEAALGTSHPDVAVSLLGIGYTLVAAERAGEAIPIQRRALAMFEQTVGAEHPYVIYAANALGMGLLNTDAPAAAIAPLSQALALRGKVKVDPTLFGDTLFALGKAKFRTATTAAARQAGVSLVREARDTFAIQAERWAGEIDKIDAWLADPA